MSELKPAAMLGYMIKLEHSEIETIREAAMPVAAILALVPKIGPALAAVIASYMWLIWRVDRKHGERGVVIVVNSLVTTIPVPIVRGPDSWYE